MRQEQHIKHFFLFCLFLVLLSACSSPPLVKPDFSSLENAGIVTFTAKVTAKQESVDKYGQSIGIDLVSQDQGYGLYFFGGQVVSGMVNILNGEEITDCIREKYDCNCKKEERYNQLTDVCSCPGFTVFDGGGLSPNIPSFKEQQCYEITIEKKESASCNAVVSGIGIEGTRSQEVVFYAGTLEVKQSTTQMRTSFQFSSIQAQQVRCPF